MSAERSRPDLLAMMPRCYHPSKDDPSLGCGRHVGHYEPHDKTIDLTAEIPAAELAKRAMKGGGS